MSSTLIETDLSCGHRHDGHGPFRIKRRPKSTLTSLSFKRRKQTNSKCKKLYHYIEMIFWHRKI